jgi:hypothetical protein
MRIKNLNSWLEEAIEDSLPKCLSVVRSSTSIRNEGVVAEVVVEADVVTSTAKKVFESWRNDLVVAAPQIVT